MLDCPLFDKNTQDNVNYQRETYNEMNITYFPFFRKISSVFNISLNSMNFSKISSLYDTLTVDRYLGRPFPAGNFT